MPARHRCDSLADANAKRRSLKASLLYTPRSHVQRQVCSTRLTDPKVARLCRQSHSSRYLGEDIIKRVEQ